MYINEKLKNIWYGCDYNPDQWLEYPEVLEKDIKLMKEAGCNVMSVGIFAWARLEPKEGCFSFEWLDEIIDRLYANGIYTILATPSGAMPSWLAEKYPEVRRVAEDGVRHRFGNRHNNCCSSLVYREKVNIINTKLAERYSKHPGILMWHISNEYNIEDCHCENCRENFRKWLKARYGTIDNLNRKWWNGFWSHTYCDFSQIDPPGDHGEGSSNPLKLEWFRFKNDNLLSFLNGEIEAVRRVNPDIPVTTNFQGFWKVDYIKLAKSLDYISWDNYPMWHSDENERSVAVSTAMFHSLENSFKKDRPFMLMESSPSATNWQKISRLRRPGVNLLASMQAVAHGSDTVQYFQWRKSRGQSEQFHGAVIGHDNTSDTRVFREVASTGNEMKNISEVTGSLTKNEAAVLFDYDNLKALEIAQVYRNESKDKNFVEVLTKHFGALWDYNVGCDFVFVDEDFSDYKIIIAPMLFMMKDGLMEKLESYVKNGGVLVSTFASGVIDEFALSFFDDECYPLRDILGIKAEETDCLYDGQYNTVEMFSEEYRVERYCELAYASGAEVIGRYKDDFYAGMPAVTRNNYGKGTAYYIGADFMQDGYKRIYGEILKDVISPLKMPKSPENVSITTRYKDNNVYVFIMNFNNNEVELEMQFDDYEVLSGRLECGRIEAYGCVVLKIRKAE